MCEITNCQKNILNYITFRCRKGYQFFGSNRDIAEKIEYKESSIKKCVNDLIQKGYLTKEMRGKKRYLTLTDKAFPKNFCDYAIEEKRLLKQENLNLTADIEYLKKELENAKLRIEYLEAENAALKLGKTKEEIITPQNQEVIIEKEKMPEIDESKMDTIQQLMLKMNIK